MNWRGPFRIPWLLLAALLLAAPAIRAGGEARIAELLAGPVGRYLLRETPQGVYLRARLAGPGRSALEGAELERALAAPELSPFAGTMESRMRSAGELIRSRRRSLGVGPSAELDSMERALLDTFALDRLRLNFSSESIEFLGTRPSYGWQEARSRFMEAPLEPRYPYRHVDRIPDTRRSGIRLIEAEIDRIRPIHVVSRPSVPKPEGYIESLKQKLLREGYNETQSVVVIEMPDGTWLNGGGHHRVQAMRELGQETVPARIYRWEELEPLTREFYAHQFPDVFARWL